MKFTSAIALATGFVSYAGAMSLGSRSVQDVFVPTITNPTLGTVWVVGTTVNVTWDTANAPAHITNNIGQVQLAQNEVATPVVLAAGFNIIDGSVSFTVPNVINGTYEIILFGDSGDISSQFTITGSNSLF